MLYLAILLLGVLIFGFAVVAKADAPGEFNNLRQRINFWAFRRRLDPALVWGVVMTESNGNPNASNPADPSTGLMGITPLIGRAYAGIAGNDSAVLEALRNPEVNLEAGTGFLAHLQARYGSKVAISEWVQAYNLGETKFDRGIRIPDYWFGPNKVEYWMERY